MTLARPRPTFSPCLSTTTFLAPAMASPSSFQTPAPQHSTPFFPGAWPNASDEGHDPDMSTVSYPGLSNLGASNSISGKARRRWTYAGPILPLAATPCPLTPTSPELGPLAVSASQGSRVSHFTDNTLSSAASSTLNTPDMARWSSLPPAASMEPGITIAGSEGRQGSPGSFTYITKASAPRHGAVVAPGQQTPSLSGHERFASPYLDPPLLNLVPGLPPLKLPVSDLPLGFALRDSPPAPPSPLSESCSTPLSFNIPSPRKDYATSSLRSSSIIPLSEIAADFFPAAEATPEPSPRPTIASLPSSEHISIVDSFVLPSSEVDLIRTPGRSHASFIRSTPSAPDMDAFALAAAVAASPSRSSLAIPPSLQSTSGSPAILERSLAPEEPRTSAYGHSSTFTETSAGHLNEALVHSHRGEDVEYTHQNLTADSADRVFMRRRSAPPPAVRRSPRPSTTKIITSRVDVGDRPPSRKTKSAKQPVFGKMRKFGEKIRGLFKNKGEGQLRHRAATVGEFGLMTTTTAITNIEYESEHPIPAPSPRSKMLRNHRRSLPLPSFFSPSSADNLASSIFKRPSASRASSSHPLDTSSGPERGAGQAPRDERSTHTYSPHTPRPQRERTRTAPQARGTEANSRSNRKARRFSLSSALSKSRLDTLRSTVMPRPPLPPMPSRTSHDDGATVVVLSRDDTARSYDSPSATSGYGVRATSRQGSYWGGELPDVQITHIPQYSLSVDDSPRRGRTQTAPPEPQAWRSSGAVATTPKGKRLRRFSLSSMMARRTSRTRAETGASHGQPPMSVTTDMLQNAPRSTFKYTRRPRGDTMSTITPRVPFNAAQMRTEHAPEVRPSLPHAIFSRSNRISLAPSTASSHTGSAYFDAREQLSEDVHQHSGFEADRSCSPALESDLDSMSFARTPDYSSGTFSFGSSIERRRRLDADGLSTSGSYTFRPEVVGRCASTSVVSQLVGDNTSTPVTKTLRFSPSLSLSFERSWSDDGDEDELGRMEREEEAGFMRALGFEFDEIARRAREGTF
ncbi:hypothetical protein C8Q79DRAFT_58501 [Trametes meyenii]|nr:hypothetical protein C8Q79DRAFT_58501 [Trametes meyenii]